MEKGRQVEGEQGECTERAHAAALGPKVIIKMCLIREFIKIVKIYS